MTYGLLVSGAPGIAGSIPEWGEGAKLVYRHYATLFFIFVVDDQESELGILDLIQGMASGSEGITNGALF